MKEINTLQRFFAFNGSNGDSPTELTRKDFEQAIISLLNNDIPMVGDSHKYGCSPILDCYFAEIAQSLVESVKKVSGFIDVRDYPSRCYALPKEIGCLGNARILVTKKKNMLNIHSLYDKPIYGVVFRNGLKAKGLLVLGCTL